MISGVIVGIVENNAEFFHQVFVQDYQILRVYK